MTPFLLVLITAAGSVSIYLLIQYHVQATLSQHSSRLPPGPKPLPLIGNVFDMAPSHKSWVYWSKHKALYGPISSVTAFGQHFIIVNDHECARELLERRSAIYSERPNLPFVSLCGWLKTTPFLKSGGELLEHRKAMHKYLGSKSAVNNLYPIFELESRRLLRRLLAKPDDLFNQISIWSSAIILKVAYGYNIDTANRDPLLELVEHSLKYFMTSAQFGTWLIDIIPSLKHIPSWTPGAYFKRFAKASRFHAKKLVNIPYQFAVSQMALGTETPSFTSFFIKEQSSNLRSEWVKWIAVTLFIGGADTSFATVYTFFLAMTLYPEVQEKAQAEIDAVVGPSRLPSFSDRTNLPYVDAVIKEVLRFHTVVPMNTPHVASQDDMYQGHLIPKGSSILVNLWHITHDPERFDDPFAFNPERFLKLGADVLDPGDVVFGYGRRVCPGKRFADASLFAAISACLATLKITKTYDANGCCIEPQFEVTDGMTSHPKHFPCTIVARSQKATDLIMSLDAVADGFETSHDAEVLRGLL